MRHLVVKSVLTPKRCSKPGKNYSIWELKKFTPAMGNRLKWKRRLRSLRGGKGRFKTLFKLNRSGTNVISVGKQIDGVGTRH